MIRKGSLDPEAEATAREAAAAQRLEGTLLDAAHQLGRIRGEWPLVMALGDSRQTDLGFVPADVKARMGAAYAEERRERREADRAGRSNGVGVALDSGGAPGMSPTPGNLGSWSLSAELALMLRGWIRRIVADHRADGATLRGLPVIAGTLPAEPSDREIIDHLRELLWTVTKVGRAVHLTRDLQHYADRLADVVDGEHRRELPGACPWCGNRTLVLYIEAGVIRCERSTSRTGDQAPCQCADPTCGCSIDPWWTHTWLRESSSTRTSWSTLARRLELQRRAADPTPAPPRRTRRRVQ